jgi:hypothetical protein
MTPIDESLAVALECAEILEQRSEPATHAGRCRPALPED